MRLVILTVASLTTLGLLGTLVFHLRERAAVETGCDVGAGPCQTRLGGERQLDLSLRPHPPRLLEPLAWEARFTGGTASNVSLTFTGQAMDMGVTRLVMDGDGTRFVATGRLPVCVAERLRWVAQVDFDLDGAHVTRRFTFETLRARTSGPGEGGAEPLGGATVDFELRSAAGPVRLSDFRGRVVLVYFGYTFCPDICPTSLAATTRALNSLPGGDLPKVQTLFVTVDPERDTPEGLATYAHFFHPSIVGLSGTPEQVARAAAPFEVIYARHQAPGAVTYSMDHSAYTYVVTPAGRLAARLPHAAPPPVVLAELAKWLPDAAVPQPKP